MATTVSVNEVIRISWQKYKNHAGAWIGITLIFLALIGILSGFSGNWNFSWDADGMMTGGSMSGNPLMQVLIWLIEMFFSFGLIRASLRHIDEDKLEVEDAIDYRAAFWRYAAASLLYGVVVFIGLVLLIVPGIYIAITYQFYGYFISDKNTKILEAFQKSAELAKGRKWNLFWIGLAFLVLGVLAIIPLGLGLLIVVPMQAIAYAWLYRRWTAPAPEPLPLPPTPPQPPSTPTVIEMPVQTSV